MRTNAERVLALLEDRAPTLGDGRLVALDGPAGSGKTTLADELAALTGAPVVHMDDLYRGWSGLPTVGDQLDGLLRPLAQGRPGRYRRWDWYADGWAETVVVPPAPLLLLEGVGSGSRTTAALVTVLVWIEVPPDLRTERGLARDGIGMHDHWRRWAVAERDHFAADPTRERADLVLDGTTGSPNHP